MKLPSNWPLTFIVMFLHIFLTASFVLEAAESLSIRQDLFSPNDLLEPINSDFTPTGDSLFFLPDLWHDDFTSGDLAASSSLRDATMDDTLAPFQSSAEDTSVGDTSGLGSEEHFFASLNPMDLVDQGGEIMAESSSPPCEDDLVGPASLIDRSIGSDQPLEELAEASEGYCIPSKVKDPQVDLPNNVKDLDDLLNPTPLPADMLDLFLKTPYRVFCPLNGDYALLCCQIGGESKRIRCSYCKSSAWNQYNDQSIPGF